MEVKDNKIELNYTLKLKDKLWKIDSPKIMGIINVTPDSFFSNSRNTHFEQSKRNIEQMINQKVDIIDVGGISTRPGANLLDSETELNRVLPVIEWISTNYPEQIISVDTFRSEIAQHAIHTGAHIVNDVYGGRYDKNMFETVGKLGVPYILMHSRGDSTNMQNLTNYSSLISDMTVEISETVQKLNENNVYDIIIDPGFGFAKTLNQNYKLLKELSHFQLFNLPILAGLSRKSMIYKLLNSQPEDALTGTSVLNYIALEKGAAILRVHDVKEAKEVKILYQKMSEVDL